MYVADGTEFILSSLFRTWCSLIAKLSTLNRYSSLFIGMRTQFRLGTG